MTMNYKVYEIENYSYYMNDMDLTADFYNNNELMQQLMNDINKYNLNIRMIDLLVKNSMTKFSKQGYLVGSEYNKKSIIFYGLRNETMSENPTYRLKLDKNHDRLFIRCQVQDKIDVYIISEISSIKLIDNKVLDIKSLFCMHYNCGSWESALSL